MRNLYITDLIEQDALQKLQETFSQMTGVAAITVDAAGNPVTQGSAFTEYYRLLCEGSERGGRRVSVCWGCASARAASPKEPLIYLCGTGVLEFAAPIYAGELQIGGLVAGQVVVEPVKQERLARLTAETGIDEASLREAAEKLPVMTKAQVGRTMATLGTMAAALSDMALGKLRLMEASEEVERAAKLKTDFLANMSHEIRTPMNAVIGMAEMALREQIPDAARNYITQIKSSGRALLQIINDILDFSKIESGKMNIVPAEYEPMELFNDVSSILMTRLMDKEVELVLNMDANLPKKLYGDDLRIRQILINIANNAIKFTNEGQVRIIVDFREEKQENPDAAGEKTILLSVAVADTGIGIKKEDLGKLFESFQQVDSKRNRNVEGTGLGLSISRSLLSLMGGSIAVESEYNKGSRFTFKVPQKVVDDTPSMKVREPKKCVAIGLFANQYLSEGFAWDCAKLGITVLNLAPDADLEKAYSQMMRRNKERTVFFFLEQSQMTPEKEAFVKTHPDVVATLVTDFFAEVDLSVPNLQIVKKPLSAMNMSMIFNREKIRFGDAPETGGDADFIAPDANVLIVDDNAVNQKVAAGLLEPLRMNTVTVGSGRDAIARAQETQFDIIFMDHMMPEMDGVETTHKIRRELQTYQDTPIIALTANAVGGAKEMFIGEGLNDFVAKPIEVRTLISKVKQWLPQEKIQKLSDQMKAQMAAEAASSAVPEAIGDLDVRTAKEMLGSEKVFWNVLKEYYRTIGTKAAAIREHYASEDWKTYTIEVHALKSASKQIGAMELSAMAMELEKAGNALDLDYIRANTDAAVEKYLAYEPVLAEFFPAEEEDESAKTEIGRDDLFALFARMREAVDNLDMDEMEAVSGEIASHRFPDGQRELAKKLADASANIDVDACGEILDEWERMV